MGSSSSKQRIKKYKKEKYEKSKSNSKKDTSKQDKERDKSDKKEEDLEIEENIVQQNLLDIISFSPLRVVSNYINNKYITPPYSEKFYGCILFIDMSGFTPLSEKLSAKGLLGVEELSNHLNSYFSKLLDIIYLHGGDVIKFAGDALLVIWSDLGTDISSCSSSINNSNNNIETYLLRCIQCALQLHLEVDGFSPAPGLVLKIRSAIGSGELYGLHVGGANSKREYIIKGKPLDQIKITSNVAMSGQIVLSNESFRVVHTFISGIEIDYGCFLVDKVNSKYSIPIVPLSLKNILTSKFDERFIKTMLKTYIPNSVLPRLDSGMVKFLAELRTVCTLFILLPEFNFNGDISSPNFIASLDKLQSLVLIIQEACFSVGGIVRQLITDDKGTVMILAFGLTNSNLNCAPQGVYAALRIISNAAAIDLGPVSIGISTGDVFCGTVGNSTRCEFAMVGDKVNTSSRLMCKIGSLGGILTDNATYLAANEIFDFEELPSVRLKGKAVSLKVYKPSFPLNTSSKYQVNENWLASKVISNIEVLNLVELTLLKNKGPFIGREEEYKIVESQLLKLRKTYKNNANNSELAAPVPNLRIKSESPRSGFSKLLLNSTLSEYTVKSQHIPTDPSEIFLKSSPILVEGGSGVGKSCFLAGSIKVAKNLGSFVFIGLPEESEQFSLYYAFRSILPNLICALATILPEADDSKDAKPILQKPKVSPRPAVTKPPSMPSFFNKPLINVNDYSNTPTDDDTFSPSPVTKSLIVNRRSSVVVSLLRKQSVGLDKVTEKAPEKRNMGTLLSNEKFLTKPGSPTSFGHFHSNNSTLKISLTAEDSHYDTPTTPTFTSLAYNLNARRSSRYIPTMSDYNNSLTKDSLFQLDNISSSHPKSIGNNSLLPPHNVNPPSNSSNSLFSPTNSSRSTSNDPSSYFHINKKLTTSGKALFNASELSIPTITITSPISSNNLQPTSNISRDKDILNSFSILLPFVVACKRIANSSILSKHLVKLLPLLNDVNPIFKFSNNEDLASIPGESRQIVTEYLIIELFRLLVYHTNSILILIDDIQYLDSSSESLLDIILHQFETVQLILTHSALQNTSLNLNNFNFSQNNPLSPTSKLVPTSPLLETSHSVLLKKRTVTQDKGMLSFLNSVLQLPNLITIKLNSFSISQIHSQLCAILNVWAVEESLLFFIFEKCDGNPLYASEIILSLKNVHGVEVVDLESLTNRKFNWIESLKEYDFVSNEQIIKSHFTKLNREASNSKSITQVEEENAIPISPLNRKVSCIRKLSVSNPSETSPKHHSPLITDRKTFSFNVAFKSVDEKKSISDESNPKPPRHHRGNSFGGVFNFAIDSDNKSKNPNNNTLAIVLKNTLSLSSSHTPINNGSINDSEIDTNDCTIDTKTQQCEESWLGMNFSFALPKIKESSATDSQKKYVCVFSHSYIKDPTSLKIPENIVQIMGMRLDKLKPALQMLIKVASVVGLVFTLDVIHSIYPIREKNVLSLIPTLCEDLCEADFLISFPSNKKQFQFRHIAIRDVAYNRLPFSFRAQLHKAIANCYIDISNEEEGSFKYYSLIGMHWLASSRANTSDFLKIEALRMGIIYLEQAAIQSFAKGAHQEVISLLETAIENIDSILSDISNYMDNKRMEFRIRLLFGLSLVNTVGYQPKLVSDNFTHLLLVASELNDDVFLLKSLCCYFMTFLFSSETDNSKPLKISFLSRKAMFIFNNSKNLDVSMLVYEVKRILATSFYICGHYSASLLLCDSLISDHRPDSTFITYFQAEVSIRCMSALAGAVTGRISECISLIEYSMSLSETKFPFSIVYVCQKSLSVFALFEMEETMVSFLDIGFEECNKQQSPDSVIACLNVFELFHQVISTNSVEAIALVENYAPSHFINLMQPIVFLIGCRLFQICNRFDDGLILTTAWLNLVETGIMENYLISECYRFFSIFERLIAIHDTTLSTDTMTQYLQSSTLSLIASIALAHRQGCNFLLLRSYNALFDLLTCSQYTNECFPVSENRLKSFNVLSAIDGAIKESHVMLQNDVYISSFKDSSDSYWTIFEEEYQVEIESTESSLKFAAVPEIEDDLIKFKNVYSDRLLSLYGSFDSIDIELPDFHNSQTICEKFA